MDFNDTAEEAAFRTRAREWLEANAPKRDARAQGRSDAQQMADAKAWQAKKAAAGYAQIT